ncbi:Gfo/Idh/MocA family protein [Vallitalea guaymasensis]|uniref:Gfo/Idh/MocA family oxidoreductase n=1 Tax=Vallitalea guaymasensis TaxID=1185412 RepID=A0A8J8MBW5_9FIRM|nr:Gfo/Idh/MocA family oxidoreductase [Vallitalea guaymasensis]QUH29938.1 Gfo/Idh/MocA family oxidoreductase [Vallitalea guaymasensis]
MEQVRIGVIGFGNMGSNHAKSLYEGKVKNGKLVAVCDINEEKLKKSKELYSDIMCYDNHHDMLEDSNIDAVIVATPHYDHPSIAIDALKANKHVVIEKPAGVYTKAVREMNEVGNNTDRVFAIMYNQRTDPYYSKVKELIDAGELGEIRRVNWIITDWYRPQSYYNSGGWRATWAGEGGGVLLNQDPHQLDIWQWICGMPTRIRAFCHFGKMHDIEVEDDVTAYAEYANGATGVFVTSTSDAPGTNRLEISGDQGKIVVEDGKITFWRLRVSEREFNATFTGGFGNPECWKCEINVKPNPLQQHVAILTNFVDAILNGKELIAPAVEGIRGLTISNAMHLSAWTDDWVNLPIDEDLYYSKLQEKIKNSTIVKETKSVTLDVDGTF